ncbi:MAG: hypothetical protein F6K32_05220 [Desertifilum sp. SIO1I2]|nr:hypothetical protein [Desertifilum sp. SIO1I2]
MTPFFQKLPWISLSILVLTYTTYGFTLPLSPLPEVEGFQWHRAYTMWAIAAALAVFFAALLTAPLRSAKTLLAAWSKTDLGILIAAVGFAFTAVLAISQIYIFATGLILLSAGSLARLDIQTAGYTERQAFWILTVTSLIGLIVGWLMHYYRALLGF